MRLIINASSIFKGGAEQVVHSFINECKAYPENEYHILLCDNIYRQLEIESFDSNFHFYKLDARPASGFITFFKSMSYFNKLEKMINPDCVISTGGHGYWKPKSRLVVGYNIPHHVYSDSPYFNMLSLKEFIYWKLRKKFDLFFYRSADAIIVQTDDVNKRLSNLLPDTPIFTVSNTINSSYLNHDRTKTFLPDKNSGEIRLLTLSANYKHKNLSIIKEVIPELKNRGVKNFKFVLTLPDYAYEEFREENLNGYIVNVGPVTIKDCPSLYEECDFMFLPTLLECFSASYVEAMYMKKPILTSNLPFARTVCKDAAMYFDPLDPKDISKNIENLIEDPDLQKKLIWKGYKIMSSFNTPRMRAKEFISICNL